MSTILKALRQLEDDKQQGERSLIEDVVEPTATASRHGAGRLRRRGVLPGWLGGALVTAGVALLAWVLVPLVLGGPAGVAGHAARTAGTPGDVASAPAPGAPAAVVTREPAARERADVAGSPAAPARPGPAPEFVAPPPRAQVARAAPPLPAVAAASDRQPARERASAAAVAVAETAPSDRSDRAARPAASASGRPAPSPAVDFEEPIGLIELSRVEDVPEPVAAQAGSAARPPQVDVAAPVPPTARSAQPVAVPQSADPERVDRVAAGASTADAVSGRESERRITDAPPAPEAPDVLVVGTVWHPSSMRRQADLRTESGVVRRVREGESVLDYRVIEITPSAVVFGRDDRTVRKAIGQR